MTKTLGQLIFEARRDFYVPKGPYRVEGLDWETADEDEKEVCEIAAQAVRLAVIEEGEAFLIKEASKMGFSAAELKLVKDEIAKIFTDLNRNQIEERSDEVDPEHHSANLTQKAEE